MVNGDLRKNIALNFGNISQASRELGISPTTLRAWLENNDIRDDSLLMLLRKGADPALLADLLGGIRDIPPFLKRKIKGSENGDHIL